MKKLHFRIYLFTKYETDFCKEMAIIAANTNADQHTLSIDKIFNLANAVKRNGEGKYDDTSIYFDRDKNTLVFDVINDLQDWNTALILQQIEINELDMPVDYKTFIEKE